MRRCNIDINTSRHCLYNSMRTVNVIVNIFGIAMIIYSLWLLKKWAEGVEDLPSVCDLPRPWFIFVCLGVGIVVCLSTLSGHMVANCINKSVLAVYIISIFSLLIIQAGVIVTILFRIDWEETLEKPPLEMIAVKYRHSLLFELKLRKWEVSNDVRILSLGVLVAADIIKYIDEHHEEFQDFVLFHLVMCRLIAILVLAAQVSVVVLAAILWVVGEEPTIQTHIRGPLDITQSFLTVYDSPGSGSDDQRCLEEMMKSYMEGIFSRSFRQIRRSPS